LVAGLSPPLILHAYIYTLFPNAVHFTLKGSQQGPLKRWYLITTLHGITAQKTTTVTWFLEQLTEFYFLHFIYSM